MMDLRILRLCLVAMISLAAGPASAASTCSIVKTTFAPHTSQGITNYGDLVLHFAATTDTATIASFMVPVDMVGHSLKVTMLAPPGTGDIWRMTIRDDGVATALTCDIADLETSCVNQSDEPVFDAGSRLTLVVSSAFGASAPDASGFMMLSFCLENAP